MASCIVNKLFQNIELNAAHHLRFLVETLWSPKTMLLIKFPKVWVSMTAIIFCLCILWKACITWHFRATNRKLTFSLKITPLGAIPPLKQWCLLNGQQIEEWVTCQPIAVPSCKLVNWQLLVFFSPFFFCTAAVVIFWNDINVIQCSYVKICFPWWVAYLNGRHITQEDEPAASCPTQETPKLYDVNVNISPLPSPALENSQLRPRQLFPTETPRE